MSSAVWRSRAPRAILSARRLAVHVEARQRELRVAIDPLLAAAEAGGEPLRHHLVGLVLVRALRPDGFVLAHLELEAGAGNRDRLPSHADQVGFDALRRGIPGGSMPERGEVEVPAELVVDTPKHVAVERGGHLQRVALGEDQIPFVLYQGLA